MAVCQTKQTAGRLIRISVFLGEFHQLWQQFPIATIIEVQRQDTGYLSCRSLCKETLCAEIYIGDSLEVCLSRTPV